ncbi:MAG: IMP cyclohydrolase [Aristaeellaceae bacterium]
MQTESFYKALSANDYPGRGIMLGLDEKGENAVIVYFIMGRSVNSRNRVFVERDGGIITRAFDESKMVDPHLIIYAPVRVLPDGQTIVTNGDQTDTVYDFMVDGRTFEDALRTRTFEDDAPNWTPRISGIVRVADGKAMYKLSILKSDNGDERSVQRFFFDYCQPQPGVGHFIHTYRCNGTPIPSFEGEPERVCFTGDIDELTRHVWDSLNADNKVSLFVRTINIRTGATETRILNKNN